MALVKTPNYDRIKAFVIARDKDTAPFEHLKFPLSAMKNLCDEIDRLKEENERLTRGG